MPTAPKRLLLFDIDGTLLHTGGAGIAAIQQGMEKAFGLQDSIKKMPTLDLAGATDAGLARFLFRHFGIEHSNENEGFFYDSYHQSLAQNLALRSPSNTGHLLPGVFQLLESLEHHESFALGLLTGNIQRGAFTKLEHFEISHFFATGAFGDDHHDRNRLGPIAIDRAIQHFAYDFTPADTVIIGDTPKDIACARACGAVAVAVATGTFDGAALAAVQPDHLFDTLEDFEFFHRSLGL